jgi:phosphate transport system permease protein
VKALAERPLWRSRSLSAPDGFRTFTSLVALATPILVLLIVLILAVDATSAVRHFGLAFLVERAWNPVKQQFGALPFVYGTVVSSFLALALALPVGVGTAIFLAEPGLARIRGVIGIGVELLAAIPSVVYGLWGLYVLAPWLLLHVSRPLTETFGSVAIFAGPARQTSLLAASVVLAVMILPTLASVSRDVVKAVPSGLREASVALGGTWWETTWKVILPAARPGILGATVLSLGRALGETIAVTMIIGNRPELQTSLLGPAYTLASVIANEFAEATGSLYPAALIELGLILMLVTLAVNAGALLLVHSVARQARAS